MNTLIVLLAAGAIAYNGTLEDVRQRRNVLFDAGLPDGLRQGRPDGVPLRWAAS